ncbi:MAG: SOS response-associated peptidase [Pseudomonadota bacterium]
MCGRFTLRQDADRLSSDITRLLEDVVISPDLLSLGTRYNIRPTETALVIRQHGQQLQLGRSAWGFRPPWMTDAYMKQAKRGPFINARSETLFEARAFSDAGRQNRCLVLADGFYEPKGDKGTQREQHFFQRASTELIAFAGIETAFPQPTQNHSTANFAILTCAPNGQVAPVHHRMPVILAPETWTTWLAQTTGEVALTALMVPWAGEPLDTWRVSTLINQRDAEGPACVAPYKEAVSQAQPAAQGSLF